jgi:branched-chain amino acid aminotransferase
MQACSRQKEIKVSGLWNIGNKTADVQRQSDARRAEILANPGFGKYFTDSMVTADWDVQNGWHNAQLIPYGPITLDPATNFMHYGQAVFEGLKAYRHEDGSVKTFRPFENARRFQRSARRLAMSEVPEELFVASIEDLVAYDQAWVPGGRERSLYLRPFLISTEVGLGVRPANAYKYILIASPAGAYFAGGINPVSVWISDEYVRAAPGGTGEAKCAGNYAASLLAQAEAAAHGCDQVVWLDAINRQSIEEMGGMNLYFVYGSGDSARIMTPQLTGSLLPGITRESLVTVAKDLGIQVDQGEITVDQLRAGCETGEITEVFACGTAAVITPVGTVKSRLNGPFEVSEGKSGEITLALRNALLDIQSGAVLDRHNWMHTLVD